MNLGGLRFGPLADDERHRILDEARAAALTYDHVGSTLDPARWSAPGVHTRHLDLGTGAAAFEAGRDALRTWVAHAGIGASIEPAGQAVVAGATLLVVLRRGPVHVVAPDRIIGVIEEPRRFGFAYGSLPGHPERGEESFVVEHLPEGTVRASIRVQAGPGTLAARAVAPLVRRLQSAAVGGYLTAIADHVRTSVRPTTPTGDPA